VEEREKYRTFLEMSGGDDISYRALLERSVRGGKLYRTFLEMGGGEGKLHNILEMSGGEGKLQSIS
jgi:hypothetical protein